MHPQRSDCTVHLPAVDLRLEMPVPAPLLTATMRKTAVPPHQYRKGSCNPCILQNQTAPYQNVRSFHRRFLLPQNILFESSSVHPPR